LKEQTEPLPPRAAAQLVADLADAVEHAHSHGVLHRDLKPANVLMALSREPPADTLPAPAGGSRLNEAVVKITDSGLAKRLVSEGSATARPGYETESGAILGTPRYMAPEQAEGSTREVREPADVYALGAILYELLTGRPPFAGETALDTLLQVR